MLSDVINQCVNIYTDTDIFYASMMNVSPSSDLPGKDKCKHVGFSFCLIFNEMTDFLYNRIDFWK